MNKTHNLALGGLFTALGVIFIYLSNIVPTSKIYLLGIASCIIPLSIITTSIKNSFLIYLSTSILSLLLLGIKGGVIVYITFFGCYGFIKLFVERIRNTPIELLLKLLFFNVDLVLIFIFYRVFFANLLNIKLPIYAAIIMFQLIFLIYDYALTVFIAYINRRLKK